MFIVELRDQVDSIQGMVRELHAKVVTLEAGHRTLERKLLQRQPSAPEPPPREPPFNPDVDTPTMAQMRHEMAARAASASTPCSQGNCN